MASGGRSDPIERKTQELIDALKESSRRMSVTEILGCRRRHLRSDRDPLRDLLSRPDPLTDLLRSHSQLFVDVLEAEAEARIQTHEDLLCGSPSLDIHYQNLVDIYQPQSSRTRDVLTDMLTRVCHIMATESPLFAFRPVGVGSHRDGTKTDYSDLDFVLVSLYRPREDSMERSSEDSMERSSEDSMERSSEDSMGRSSEDSMGRSSEDSPYRPREDTTYRPREDSTYRPREDTTKQPREDSPYRPGEDYRVSGRLPKVSILPVVGSVFHKRCEERGVLECHGRLNVSEYRDQLGVQLSSVMSVVCSQLGLSFGGWNRPHFGGFERNGPAWSVVVDGVSVDITPTFTAPRDIKDEEGRRVMQEIAERVSSTVSEDERSDWVNMGLVVLTRDIDGGYGCQLSTSLVEADVIRTVPQLQSALKICKVYRDQFFDLPGPDLRPFFRHLEGRVLEWLVSGGCDTLLRAVPGDPDRRVVDELKDHPKLLLLLATQRRPLTLNEDILQKLETIKRRIGEEWRYNRPVDPCLKSLVVSKPPKPAVKTISFVFKCLLLDKWLTENRITTERLVEHVMEEYSGLVEEYNGLMEEYSGLMEEDSGLLAVPHPFLSSSLTDPVDVFTFIWFYHEVFLDSRPFYLIHEDMVQQIVSEIKRLTPTPPVSDPPRPPLTDPSLISDDDWQIEVLTDTRQQSCQQRMADWWRRCCCCSCSCSCCCCSCSCCK